MNLADRFQEIPPEPSSSPFRWFLEGAKRPAKIRGRYFSTDLGYVPQKRLGPRTELVIKLLLLKPGLTIEEMKVNLGPATKDLVWRIGKYEGLLREEGEKWFVSTLGEDLFFANKKD
jgi:hypothetical protein